MVKGIYYYQNSILKDVVIHLMVLLNYYYIYKISKYLPCATKRLKEFNLIIVFTNLFITKKTFFKTRLQQQIVNILFFHFTFKKNK